VLAVGCGRQAVDLSENPDEGSGGTTAGGGGANGTGTGTGTGSGSGTGTGTATGQGGGTTTGGGGAGQGGATTTTTAGGGGQGGGQQQLGSIAIEPGNATIDLPNGQAQTLGYTVTFKDQNGNPQDVTAQAKLWLEDDLGSFSGATLKAEAPGKTTIHAQWQGYGATALVTITMGDVVLEPGAPGDAPQDFGGPKGGGASLVYPADGLLVPPNMNRLEVHFVPAPGDTLFELALTSPKIALKAYFPCTAVGGGCAYAMSKAVWHAVSDAARGGDPVSFKIRGVNGQSPGAVSESPTRTISFGQENVTGGVYYWNANPGVTMRYEFGKSGQAAEKYLTAGQAGAGQCVGCHVVSRNGSRIAVGLDIPGPSQYKVYDVATKNLYYTQGSPLGGGGANFFSFTPDGKRLLTSGGIQTTLRSADDGTAIGPDPLWKNASMPDFSPDGAHVVFVKAASPPPCIIGCGATGTDKGTIVAIDYDGQSFSNEHALVPYQGQNNYYPAFSPDGKWVLFNRSPSDVNSYDAPDAEVWVVPAAGGQPIKLAKSWAGGDSWPKWTSSTQAYKGKSLLWLTFSSRRAYGLRLADKQRAQIWMTAFDPEAAAAGKDPSYPAFWMPFQDLASANHIAQWVEKVVRKPCQGDADCGGSEACLGGICMPKP
jgi:hypothetical protein